MKRKPRKGFDQDNGFGQWGGYMEAKIQKLQEQYVTAASRSNPFKKSDLFLGVSIYVNGLTNPSADELKRIMLTNGGIYHAYQRPSTTFLIAQNLPDVKIRQITTAKIISPQWVVDCVKENRVLDYSNYLLYTQVKTNQPKLSFSMKSKDNVNKTDGLFVDGSDEHKKQLFKKDDEQKNEQDLFNILEDLNILNQKIRESEQFIGNNLKEDKSSDDVETVDDDIVKISSSSNIKKSPSTKIKDNLDISNKQQLAKTAVDPNFLTEFYNNSRLHHISTLGAGFKNFITDLREKSDGEFPERAELLIKFNPKLSIPLAPLSSATTATFVMHIDMDCFFVSVGLRTRPNLRGHAVAVTHSKGSSAPQPSMGQIRPGADPERERQMYEERMNKKAIENVMGHKAASMPIDGKDSLSEIASCSYEARALGIKNGMFVGAALKLCPNLKTIPYDFEGYREVATTLYNTIAKYTLNIEAVSCDEMYVDITELLTTTGINVLDFVQHVRNEIQIKTGCPCSAGVGGNRLQARMATKQAKPNGQYLLESDNVEKYFSTIKISDLPGVGHNTTYKLNQLGWYTCADLIRIPLVRLQHELGKKFGETLYQFCRGIDQKPLVFGQIRKSVSAEVNYGIRFKTTKELDTFLNQLCEEVHSRLCQIKRRGKTITLKLMIRSENAPVETAKFMGHGVCDHQSKSITLPDFTNDLSTIKRTILTIKKQFKINPIELRGLGIQINKLDEQNSKSSSNAAAAVAATGGNTLKSMFEKVVEKKQQKPIVKQENIIEKDEQPTKRRLRSMEITENRSLRNGKIIKKESNIQTELLNERKLRNSNGGGGGSKSKKPSTSVTNEIKMSPKQVKQSLAPPPKSPSPPPQPPPPPPPIITNSQDTDETEIDMDVVAELPAEIREEILRDYKPKIKINSTIKNQLKINETSNAKNNNKNNNNSSDIEIIENVDAEFLAALPSDLRQEVIRDHENKKKNNKVLINKKDSLGKIMHNKVSSSSTTKLISNNNNEQKQQQQQQPSTSSKINDNELFLSNKNAIAVDNIFLRNDWRRIFQAWLDSCIDEDDEPVPYDVTTFAQDGCELVRARRLNDIYLAFRYFYRIVEERKWCTWHRAYREIVNTIQEEMMTVYKAKLQISENFHCMACKYYRKIN